MTAVLAGCDASEPLPKSPDTSSDADSQEDTDTSPGIATPWAVEPMHRLTALEYQRSVRDLFGTEPPSKDELPADDVGYGFSTVDRIQVVSPLHVDRWYNVARDVATRVVSQTTWSQTVRIADLALPIGRAYDMAADSDPAWWLFNEATSRLTVRFDVPRSGDYQLWVDAAWVSGWRITDTLPVPTPLELTVMVDTLTVPMGTIDTNFDTPTLLTTSVPLQAGTTWVSLSLSGAPVSEVALGHIGLVSLDPTLSSDRALPCESPASTTCAQEGLDALVRRAWRRPPTTAELERLSALVQGAVDDGDTVEHGFTLATQAILLSPKFLFLVEPAGDHEPGVARALTPDELAGRLALVLWRSVPDNTLTQCAASGGLGTSGPATDPCHLNAQISRMLEDTRADAFSRDFAAQWVGTDALDNLYRDELLFPFRDSTVVNDMRHEVEVFSEAVARAHTPLSSLIVSDFRVLTPQLSDLYDIPIVPSTPFTQVTPGSRASGLLQLAALHTAAAHPTRTSPVRRGIWILAKLLCIETGEPPAGIPELQDDVVEHGTLREQLAAHSSDPSCSYCHAQIDPLGLSLEGYDQVGRRRSDIEGLPIDASGELPDGSTFINDGDLADLLAADPAVHACITRQLATWALGRPLDATYTPVLEQAADAAHNGIFAALASLASSTVVTHRTTQEPADAP